MKKSNKCTLKFIFLFLVFALPLKADPIYLKNLKIYFREGFEKQSTHELWTEKDSVPIVINEGYIPIPIREKNLFLNPLKIEKQMSEFSVQIQIPRSLLSQYTNPGLKIYQIGEFWEVFQDQYVIESHLTTEPNKRKNFIFPLIVERTQSESLGSIITITLRVRGNSLTTNFGLIFNEGDKFDEYSTIQMENTEIFPFISIGFFLLSGTYLIYLYYRIRRNKEVLFFGVFQIIYFIFTLSLSNFANIKFGNSDLLLYVKTNAVYLSFLSIVYFHDYYLLNRIQRISKIVSAIVFILLAFYFFFPDRFPNLASILFIIETPHLFFYLIVMAKILKKGYFKNKLRKTPLSNWKFFLHNRAGVLSLVILFVASAIYFETVLELTLKIKTPIVIISTILYSLFIGFLIIRRIEDALIQKTKLQLNSIFEKRQFELDKIHAIQMERKHTFGDIHDETSADLTFIKLMLQKYIKERQIAEEHGKEILQLVNRVILGIREKLQSLDDEKNVSEDLVTGIMLLLLRKYQSVGKIVNWDTKYVEEKSFSFPTKTIVNLCRILREVANNDVKYGLGVSYWKIQHKEKWLIFELSAKTGYTVSRTSKGYGNKNIQDLAKEMRAEVSEELKEDSYLFRMKLVV